MKKINEGLRGNSDALGSDPLHCACESGRDRHTIMMCFLLL